MMADLHFLRPEWLVLIPVWLVLVAWVRFSTRTDTSWDRVCDPGLAPYVVDGGTRRSRAFHLGAALAGVLAAVAVAGPAWRELPQPVFRSQSALVVALDVSRSMQAGDIRPSRLVRARHKVLDLLEQRVDGRTALVAYAGDAFAVTPLTSDTRTIAALVSSLDPEIMPAPGSRADRAVDQARELLEQASAPRGRVLLITDSARGSELDEAVERLTDAGYVLSVIGVGEPSGAPIPEGDGFVRDPAGDVVLATLEEPFLQALAQRGGGAYARYRLDDGDLRSVLPEDRARGGADTAFETDRWREEGPWLLLVVAVLVLPLFRRGRLD